MIIQNEQVWFEVLQRFERLSPIIDQQRVIGREEGAIDFAVIMCPAINEQANVVILTISRKICSKPFSERLTRC